MHLRSFLFAAMSLLIVGCSEGGGEPDTQEVYVSIGEVNLNLTVGDAYRLVADTDPDNIPLEWSSEDSKIADVDQNGVVTALSPGNTVIMVSSGEASSACNVSVVAAPVVEKDPYIGDFYYSDGTFSSEPDFDKDVVGIIFWVGDPTKDDPILKKEHPECTHGLVISIEEEPEGQNWQKNWQAYNSTIGEWQNKNMPGEYKSVMNPMNQDDNLNIILGYNNTKVLEAFNAAPENSEWPVNIIGTLEAYREKVKLPEETSGWYIPSAKELSLLYSGDYDGNVLDIDNEGVPATENKSKINYKLKMLPVSTEIGTLDYWASSERDKYMSFYVTMKGWLMIGYKNYANFHQVRYVFAF